jgi:hypothetical protein
MRCLWTKGFFLPVEKGGLGLRNARGEASVSVATQGWDFSNALKLLASVTGLECDPSALQYLRDQLRELQHTGEEWRATGAPSRDQNPGWPPARTPVFTRMRLQPCSLPDVFPIIVFYVPLKLQGCDC